MLCHREPRVFSGPEGVAFYEELLAAYYRARGARSHRIATGAGDSVHVLERPGRGDLPPMMLVHGFSASGASQYGAFSERLLPHVRQLVLPDLPGHGLSTIPVGGLDPERMADALVRTMDEVLAEPTIVFASSMAGGLAVHAALRRPEKVRALVLCSPSGAPFAPDELDRFDKTFTIRTHRDALEFLDRLLPSDAKPAAGLLALAEETATRHAYAWGVRRQFNRRHLVGLLRRVPTMRFLEPAELGALTMPVYLIWGRGDDILPPSQVAFYRAHLPEGATIETPAHFGHTPFLHHPGELAARLLAFSRKL